MTMTFDLPESMQRFVENEVAKGGFADPSDYLRDLIRREQVRRAKIADMQRLIDEARAEPTIDMTMEEILEEVRGQAGARQRDAA